LVILVLASVALTLAGRGRKLKCPNCGTVFEAPAMNV
jgi:hypothetical protein